MRTVLITGISSGIGYESAIKFARSGWQVAGIVRNTSTGIEQLQKIITDEKLSIKLWQADVRNDEQLDSAIQNIIEEYKTIDVLINNSGFGYLGPVECFDISEIQEQYDVNVFGAIRMIKKIVPVMRDNKKGTIINVSSVNGLVSFPIYGVYSSSKFALETLSEALRFELKPFGIRVAIVEPGYFQTNFSKNVKIAKNASTSVYANWVARIRHKLLDKDDFKHKFLDRTTNSKRVANLIYKIANTAKPKIRYKIGLDTYIYTFLRKLLPYDLWAQMINSVYKWPDK